MTELPYLELSIFLPIVGAICVSRLIDAEQARKWSMVVTGFACLFAVGVWQESLAHRGSTDIVAAQVLNGIVGSE
jgi:hypothetical protein